MSGISAIGGAHRFVATAMKHSEVGTVVESFVAQPSLAQAAESTLLPAMEGLHALGVSAAPTTAPPGGLWTRVSGLFTAKAGDAVRTVERDNAASLARKAMEAVESQQQGIKSTITTVGTAVNKTRLMLDERIKDLDATKVVLGQAVELGDRDAFGVALNHKATLETQIARLESSVTSGTNNLKDLKSRFLDNENQISTFKMQLELDIAENEGALAIAKVAESAAGVSGSAGDLAHYVNVLRESTKEAHAKAASIDSAIQDGTIQSVLGGSAAENMIRARLKDETTLDNLFNAARQQLAPDAAPAAIDDGIDEAFQAAVEAAGQTIAR